MNRVCEELRREYRRWYSKLMNTEDDDIEKKNYINDVLVEIEDQIREECGEKYFDKIGESFELYGREME